MEVKIRKATNKDYLAIEEIERLVFDKPKTRKEFESRLNNNPNPYFIVAELNGKVVGYAMGYDVKGKLYNCFFAVHPKFQRKGIGTLLLKETLAIAQKKDYKNAFFKTSPDFIGMIVLALGYGFKIIGYKDKEWGNRPAIWLEKKI